MLANNSKLCCGGVNVNGGIKKNKSNLLYLILIFIDTLKRYLLFFRYSVILAAFVEYSIL